MEFNVVSSDEGKPITLDLVKGSLKITDNNDDTFLNHLIGMASALVEKQGRVSLLKSTYSVTYETPQSVGFRETDYDPDGIADYIKLPRGPVLEIKSVFEIDENGNTTAFTGYKVNKNNGLIYWVTYPSKPYIQFNYSAGYNSDTNIPAIYKQAMLVAIQKGYEDRSGSVDDLIWSIDQVLAGFKDYMVLG